MVLLPEIQAKILHMHFSEHLSQRKIAETLGVNRKTVSAVIERRRVLLSGSERSPRKSILEPYYTDIDRLLQKAPMRSAVNILQQLREKGYKGGISTLREYLRKVRLVDKGPKKAFFKLDFSPGQAAQVDWGEFGDFFNNGTKLHAFVMVLCHSRMLYTEFTLRETLPTLLRCHERALRFFGGRCGEHWYDNMPTVVAQRHGQLLRFTDGFYAYAGFHNLNPVLCNLGAGNEKGRVEDGVKSVRHQFMPGRSALDIDDLNHQAAIWRDRFFNCREHEETKKIPLLVFEQEEKKCLQALRSEAYETDDVVTSVVNHQYRIHFESNRYTVPWTLVGKTLTIRADDHEVRIYYGTKKVAGHRRCYQKNQDIQKDAHAEGLKEMKPGAERNFEIQALTSFGPNTKRYLDFISVGTRSLRSEVRHLLCLGTVYGKQQVENIIGELLKSGQVGVAHIERMLRLKEVEEIAPAPLELHNERLQFVPQQPALDAYDSLLLHARQDVKPKTQEEESK